MFFRKPRLHAVDKTKTRWLFGPHHKAGTYMLFGLMDSFVHALKLPPIPNKDKPCSAYGLSSNDTRRVIMPCQLTLHNLQAFRNITENDKRILHIIRDPVRLVVSGYVYHSYVDDGKFSDFTSKDDLRKLPITEGIELFAEFAISNWLTDMIQVYNHSKSSEDTITVNLEKFTGSSKAFDTSVAEVYQYMVGDMVGVRSIKKMQKSAKRFDVSKHPTEHATSILFPNLTQDALSAVEALSVGILKRLHQMRKRLGYT